MRQCIFCCWKIFENVDLPVVDKKLRIIKIIDICEISKNMRCCCLEMFFLWEKWKKFIFFMVLKSEKLAKVGIWLINDVINNIDIIKYTFNGMISK